jgi:hypothetical protein
VKGSDSLSPACTVTDVGVKVSSAHVGVSTRGPPLASTPMSSEVASLCVLALTTVTGVLNAIVEMAKQEAS